MGLDTPPALTGAGVRDGRGGRSPPTDVVRVGRNGALVAAFIGGSAPLPPGLLRGSAASEAKQRTPGDAGNSFIDGMTTFDA